MRNNDAVQNFGALLQSVTDCKRVSRSSIESLASHELSFSMLDESLPEVIFNHLVS